MPKSFLVVSSDKVRFQPPLPEPCLHLSAHTALQLTRSFLVGLPLKAEASRLTFPSLLAHLSPFPLCLAFPGSLVGRNSYEYYGDSVTLGLTACRPSRIPVKSNVLSAFRLRLSSNPFIAGHSSQVAFRSQMQFERIVMSPSQRGYGGWKIASCRT
jgi:hypothetical protein